MVSHNKSHRLVALIAPPAVVAITAAVLFQLPSEIRIVLTLWILLSLPFGALLGHCVLSEEKPRIRPFPPLPAISGKIDRIGYRGLPDKTDR